MLNLTMLLVPIEAAEVALPEESSGEVFCCGDFFFKFLDLGSNHMPQLSSD